MSAYLRIRPNNVIQYDISVFGKRFRETSGLPATPSNIKKVKQVIKQINARIDLKNFEYRDFFPHSKKCQTFAQLKRQKLPNSVTPYFDNFASDWLARNKHQWKNSYYKDNNRIITNHLTPYFGCKQINEITLKDVQSFRAGLCELTNSDGSRRLGNKRINIMMVPLISMLHLAADEFDFPYPLNRLKPLREEKSDPKPLTQREVEQFLQAVPTEYYDYYLLRFYTGLRSCEIHGLKIDCIDFDNRLIKVRRNLVGNTLSSVKTPKSNRDIYMTQPVYLALQRAVANMDNKNDFVFTNHLGNPLSTHFISYKVWTPTLKKVGIKHRPCYQTRHTCAVLHLAAHENPLYVSSLLGHSGTKMLYEVYAPYVQNAARQDGSAFEAMMHEPEQRQ